MTSAQKLLGEVLDALTGAGWAATIDQLKVPVYLTDTEGSVTYWNRACADFAGREPELGRDRWCVTWKLFTTAGDPSAELGTLTFSGAFPVPDFLQAGSIAGTYDPATGLTFSLTAQAGRPSVRGAQS